MPVQTGYFDFVRGQINSGSIAVDATYTLTHPTNCTMLLLIREGTQSGGWALFACSTDAGGLTLISSAIQTWSVTKDTPASVNVYLEANVITVQNKRAGTISCQFIILITK